MGVCLRCRPGCSCGIKDYGANVISENSLDPEELGALSTLFWFPKQQETREETSFMSILNRGSSIQLQHYWLHLIRANSIIWCVIAG